MSSDPTGGDEGGIGVELGASSLVSRVRLRVGEDYMLIQSSNQGGTILR